MTPPHERPRGDELVERLAELAREAPAKHLTPQEWAGLHRLERAVRARGERHGRTFKLVAATALAASALGVTLRLRDRALTYQVTNATVSEGGYIATTGAEATLRFSDRSELGVAPGTRVRVSHLEVHGARVMLEGGMLHVRIRPEPHATWTLDAGPYVVHVTGTEFDLAWRVDEQTLDLRLHKGSVMVDGPLADAGVRVAAGQHLVANGGAGTLSLVDELNGHAPSSDGAMAAAPAPAASTLGLAPSPSPSPASSEAPPASTTAAPAEAPAGTRSHGHVEAPRWKGRVAHGDFEGVIADAERRGVDRVLAESPVADLAALADAARYARRQDLARRALMAQRARYPGSMQARDASFFLGGLAESAPGERDDAVSVDWYDVYLGENPEGAYASQALGRKMMLLQRLKGPDGARAIVSEYLARFPDGPYAGAANRLLRAQ
jgi:TolA-binding protein